MLEQYEKIRDKNATPEETSISQLTLKDILKDKEKSSYFGKMLERDKNIELAERLAGGKLYESDIDLLEAQLSTFTELIERVESVNIFITKDMVESLALDDPDFQKILKLLGSESTVEIYKKQMMDLCISDEEYFDKIEIAVKNFDSYKNGEWKDVDDRIVEICKNENISEEEYLKAIMIENEDEREKAIRNLVRGGYGVFQKVGDWVSQGSLSNKRIDLIDFSKGRIEDTIATLKSYKKSVSGMLMLAAKKSPDIKKALSQELIGDIQPKEDFGEIKNTVPTSESLQRGWEVYKQDKIKNWDTLSSLDQDAKRDEFLMTQKKEYAKKTEKKTGFWNNIFKSLFDTLISGIKIQLK